MSATSIPRPAERPWQYNIFWIFTIGGMMIIMVGIIVGIILSSTAGGYWSDNSKLARDCAGIDSGQTSEFAGPQGLIDRCAAGADQIDAESASSGAELQDDLRQLTSWPKWLEPFIFLGVMSFMIGIALEFSSIPKILENRGDVIGVCYPHIAKPKG